MGFMEGEKATSRQSRAGVTSQAERPNFEPGRRRKRRRTPGSPMTAASAAVLIFAVAYVSGLDPQFDRKLALVAWGTVAVGLAFGFLPRTRPASDSRPLLAGLSILTALSALALTSTSSIERTLDEIDRVAGFAGLVVLGLLAVERNRWKGLASGIVVGAAAVCGLAVGSRLFPDAFSADAVTLAGDRLGYPFGYWNALAAWSAMTLTMLLAWVADGRDRAVRGAAAGAIPLVGLCLSLTYSRGGLLTAALGFFVVLALTTHRRRLVLHAAAGLAATGVVVFVVQLLPEIARGAGANGGPIVALALAVACLVTRLLAVRFPIRTETGARFRGHRRSVLSRHRALAGVLASLLAVIAVPLFYVAVEDSEPVAVVTPTDPAARVLSLDGNRARYWEGALAAFADEPLSGIGPGTFEFYWARDGDAAELVRDAHSFYLEQLAELGLLGLIGAAVFAGGVLWSALLPLRRGEDGAASIAMPAAATVLLGYLAIDWVWESNAVMVLGLACATAGAACGARGASRRHPASNSETGPTRVRARGLPRGMLVGVGLLALAGAAIQVPGLVSNGRIERSARASAAGLNERALDLASDAIDAAPWAATPYAHRAFIQLGVENLAAAREDFMRAEDREPENFRHPLGLAVVEARRGDQAAARAALARARELAPEAVALTGPSGLELEGLIDRLGAG